MPRSEPHLRRWTSREYFRLADLGFFAGERVELIRGRVVAMPPMRNDHVIGVSLAEEALQRVFGPGFWVRIQAPLNLSATSAPEPDLAVVTGNPRDYREHPTTALLVVEVSDTSLKFDRQKKASLYASAGIPEYWILNVVDRQLEVYRDSQPDARQPQRSQYAQTRIYLEADTITPLSAVQGQIVIQELLP